MKLKKINFGHISCAVGALGFYGEGYPFHKWYKLLFYIFGYSWKDYTFAGKTMTLKSRRGKAFNEPGNMPLKNDGVTPQELLPKSIWVEPKIGEHMLNCVGLAGFGIEYYLRLGHYQKMTQPYFISIMDMDPENAIDEITQMCELIVQYLGNSNNSIYGVQLNCACPNTDSKVSKIPTELIAKLQAMRNVLGENIPIIANFNALVNTSTLEAIDEFVDAYWIGNTIPAGADVPGIDWSRFNVRMENDEWKSPLTDRDNRFPPGGLSGPLCFFPTREKVREMQESPNITKPIVAGNGIRSQQNVQDLYNAGAQGVFVGSGAVTKPWILEKLTKIKPD